MGPPHVNTERGSGPPGEALLLQHVFLCTVFGQMSPCTISDFDGLNLSYV